jgi:hypothetical protein
MTTLDVNPGRDAGEPQSLRDLRDDLIVVAEQLCARETDVVDAWRRGDTVAAMAHHAGIDPKTVIDALIEDRKADLAERVEWGEVRAELAESVRRDMPSRVVAFVYYGLPEVHAASGRRGASFTAAAGPRRR